MAIIITKRCFGFPSKKLENGPHFVICGKLVNAVENRLNPGKFVNQLDCCYFSVLKVKRKLKVESVTEEAASTSTTMYNSLNEEKLPSNSSVVAHTLANKQLNLPIPDLSPSQDYNHPVPHHYLLIQNFHCLLLL